LKINYFLSSKAIIFAKLNNYTMTILLLGSGGREHAFAWKMIQSPLCDTLFVAPGNAGTATIATNVAISPTDFDAIKTLVLQEKIDLVVVGPEDPLVKGIFDFFKLILNLSFILIQYFFFSFMSTSLI
jgi:phosphoribosylamine--glycine ligase